MATIATMACHTSRLHACMTPGPGLVALRTSEGGVRHEDHGLVVHAPVLTDRKACSARGMHIAAQRGASRGMHACANGRSTTSGPPGVSMEGDRFKSASTVQQSSADAHKRRSHTGAPRGVAVRPRPAAPMP